jgi:hypothetical protein
MAHGIYDTEVLGAEWISVTWSHPWGARAPWGKVLATKSGGRLQPLIWDPRREAGPPPGACLRRTDARTCSSAPSTKSAPVAESLRVQRVIQGLLQASRANEAYTGMAGFPAHSQFQPANGARQLTGRPERTRSEQSTGSGNGIRVWDLLVYGDSPLAESSASPEFGFRGLDGDSRPDPDGRGSAFWRVARAEVDVPPEAFSPVVSPTAGGSCPESGPP